MQQQTASPVKFISNLEMHSTLICPIPIRKNNIRVRSMSDESDWVPLPDDPLSTHLEKIKISETK